MDLIADALLDQTKITTATKVIQNKRRSLYVPSEISLKATVRYWPIPVTVMKPYLPCLVFLLLPLTLS